MSNLEKARIRIAAEQAKMYQLTTLPMPGLQIQISANTIQHIYATLSTEDRAILINEEYQKATRGK